MKTMTALFVSGLATLLIIGPVAAQTTTAGSSKDSVSTPSSSAEKPSKLALPHSMTGEVVSVDATAKTVTVKSAKGKERTFTAESSAAGRLADLKAGDRVKVNYKSSHGHMMASKITRSEVATKTK